MKITYFNSKRNVPRTHNLDKKIASRYLHSQSSADLLVMLKKRRQIIKKADGDEQEIEGRREDAGN